MNVSRNNRKKRLVIVQRKRVLARNKNRALLSRSLEETTADGNISNCLCSHDRQFFDVMIFECTISFEIDCNFIYIFKAEHDDEYQWCDVNDCSIWIIFIVRLSFFFFFLLLLVFDDVVVDEYLPRTNRKCIIIPTKKRNYVSKRIINSSNFMDSAE